MLFRSRVETGDSASCTYGAAISSHGSRVSSGAAGRARTRDGEAARCGEAARDRETAGRGEGARSREGGACAVEEGLAAPLRAGEPPVVTVVRDGRCLLDCRTITDAELEEAADAVRLCRSR